MTLTLPRSSELTLITFAAVYPEWTSGSTGLSRLRRLDILTFMNTWWPEPTLKAWGALLSVLDQLASSPVETINIKVSLCCHSATDGSNALVALLRQLPWTSLDTVFRRSNALNTASIGFLISLGVAGDQVEKEISKQCFATLVEHVPAWESGGRVNLQWLGTSVYYS